MGAPRSGIAVDPLTRQINVLSPQSEETYMHITQAHTEETYPKHTQRKHTLSTLRGDTHA